MVFKDLFSGHAQEYAMYRPDYPVELFEYLASLVKTHTLAWDCGTGNGQAAVILANYFKQVIASDPSAQQIQQAIKKNNIDYRIMPAEKTNIADSSVDLITIAQALHWFDFTPFYKEVRRVLKPDGIIAAWSYGLTRIDPAIDAIIDKFYYSITQPYWAKERSYLDQEYKTIPFPFMTLTPPTFILEKQWDLRHFVGYLNTWSAIKEYIKQKGRHPLELIADELQAAWSESTLQRTIHWPLFLLVGHK